MGNKFDYPKMIERAIRFKQYFHCITEGLPEEMVEGIIQALKEEGRIDHAVYLDAFEVEKLEPGHLYVIKNLDQLLPYYGETAVFIQNKKKVITELSRIMENYLILIADEKTQASLFEEYPLFQTVYCDSIVEPQRRSLDAMFQFFKDGLNQETKTVLNKNTEKYRNLFLNYIYYHSSHTPFTNKTDELKYLSDYCSTRKFIKFPFMEKIYDLNHILEQYLSWENAKEYLLDFDQVSKKTVEKRFNGEKLAFPIANVVLEGAPGTGKISFAEVYTELLYRFGYIEKKRMIEVLPTVFMNPDKSDAAGTAINMLNLLNDSGGCVLYLDDECIRQITAYNNVVAMNFLCNAMKKRKIVAVFAGSEENIDLLFQQNRMIRSFTRGTVKFKNYDNDFLIALYNKKIEQFKIEKYNNKEILLAINEFHKSPLKNGDVVDAIIENQIYNSYLGHNGQDIQDTPQDALAKEESRNEKKSSNPLQKHVPTISQKTNPAFRSPADVLRSKTETQTGTKKNSEASSQSTGNEDENAETIIRKEYESVLAKIRELDDDKWHSLELCYENALATRNYNVSGCALYMQVSNDYSTNLYRILYHCQETTIRYQKEKEPSPAENDPDIISLGCLACGNTDWKFSLKPYKKGEVYKAICPICGKELQREYI